MLTTYKTRTKEIDGMGMRSSYPVQDFLAFSKDRFLVGGFLCVCVCVRARACACMCMCVHVSLYKLSLIFLSLPDFLFYETKGS